MATVTASGLVFYLDRPAWLVGLVLLIPVVWLGMRSMIALGPVRRWSAIVLRCLAVVILVLLLARLTVARKNEKVTVIAVIDRSQSIPAERLQEGLHYLEEQLAGSGETVGDATRTDTQHRLAIVDVAEAVGISTLGRRDMKLTERNTSLQGFESRLADGIQMALAVAPPDSATRIVFLSDGNQTGGDLREAARVAASNGIPIDVVPVRYQYEREVVFRRLVAPSRARAGQTVPLRFVLNSTGPATGRLMLYADEQPVDLDPESDQVGAAVTLEPGTNVQTVSLPMDTRGMHEFVAQFIPDDAQADRIVPNNRASALTYISGPGHVVVVDTDGATGPALAEVLRQSALDARYVPISQFATDLARLMDTDAVILSNVDASSLTFAQQEMLVRYVNDLGGGLVMIGGPQSFGAGGWIGSPVAEVLPVDCDPPQKKQVPRGALVLVMHACEMPNGNMWGKKVAIAAVRTLSARDLVGVLDYGWNMGSEHWVYPFGEVGDKTAVIGAIRKMQMGDMPDFGAPMQAAFQALQGAKAGQKHVIIISDGDPQLPSPSLLNQYRQAGITATAVAVFPHSPADLAKYAVIPQQTGGRFYNVTTPSSLPQIFIKEAQVVRRALIWEETFTPQFAYRLSEILRGISAVPSLDGYVLTGPKAGFSQVLFTSNQGDPILASCQSGLGRCVAFTSSIDSRWASQWLAWPGYGRFWEQVVRWVGKPALAGDCELFVDVHGREVTVTVEAVDNQGRSIPLAAVDAQVIGPDMAADRLVLSQTGPGQYQGRFTAVQSGSYVVNLRYRRAGAEQTTHVVQSPVVVPFAPEFRDLRDNAPLLEEIAGMTNGRVFEIGTEADLFESAGLRFPQTPLTIAPWLMGAWIAVFLLDVAVRRIVVDVAAVRQRVADWLRRRRAVSTGDVTLERLKKTRTHVHERFKRRAGQRYVASETTGSDTGPPLPQADVTTPPPAERRGPVPPAASQKETAAGADGEAAHIQQLLRAKRGALRRDREGKKDHGQDDGQQ